MLQVRDKKKGWLKVEEERYQGKRNEKKERKWKERKWKWKERKERALNGKKHPLPGPVGRPSLSFLLQNWL